MELQGSRNFSKNTLDDVVVLLKRYPNLQMNIEGHTDNVGKSDYNRELSLLRAEAVADYMENRKIDRTRLKISGYGDSRPVSSNKSARGRSKNRRVELIPVE